jgi:phosphonate degradation associated HDIG domain protein
MDSIQSIEQIAEEIIEMYNRHGNEDYIGEPVSQIEHMCQCAQLAEQSGADDDTILAAFFHDIGHLYALSFPAREQSHMDGYGMVNHEKMGGQFLRSKGFSENIAMMVASHVDAKRYLTFRFPAYYESLSIASKNTLIHQGGPMGAEEASVFESDPLFERYIALRKWDELAKETNKPLPSLSFYKKLMMEHLFVHNI